MATFDISVKVTDSGGHSTTQTLQIVEQSPVAKPLMGASTTSDAVFNTLNTAVGGLKARRTYDTGIPVNFAASRAVSDAAAGRRSYWSCKPTPATFASGTNDAAWLAFLNSIPAGHKFTAIMWHEPEDNIVAGTFTLAQWKAMNNRAGQLMHSLNRPELRMGICGMGPWTFDTRGPYATTEYWDSGFAQNIDTICHDIYRWNPNDPSLEAQLTIGNSGSGGGGQTPMGWARLHNKPVVLAEWGCTETSVTQVSKAAWITAAWNWAKAQSDVEALVYFHNNQFVSTEPRSTWEVHNESLTAFAAACADSRS